MKNIILAGPSRAGKTTLAGKIHKELGHFVVSADKLVATFAGAYPQLDIRLNWNRQQTTDNLAPFLGHFLGTFSSAAGTAQGLNLQAHAVEGNQFVLEGAYFNFERIASILKAYGMDAMQDYFLLVGLVQNQKTAGDFFNGFRQHDTPEDWTFALSDEELWEVSREAVTYSQAMTEHLAKYGFTIYDTSTEREKVFDKILHDIQL